MSRRWYDNTALRGVALFVLFAFVPFVEAAHQGSLTSTANADFWWHLRVGEGILQTHALPHSGLYSQSPASPWIDASWLYDLKIAIYERVLGPLVAPSAAVAFKFALAVLTFILAGGLRGRCWTAGLISAAAQFVLVLLPPLPVYVSVQFFGVELLLLALSRREGSIRPLFWLPPLFLVWANVDANFVFGIAALLLFVAAAALSRLLKTSAANGFVSGHDLGRAAKSANDESPRGLHPARPIKTLGALAAITLVASFLTPYGWGPYGEFFTHLTSAANDYIPDALALRFRSPNDYVLLLLLASAFLALGMRRSRDPFAISLLLLCAFASFRAQRDAWLAVMASVAVLGDFPSFCHHEPAAAGEGSAFPASPPASSARETEPLLSPSQFLFAAGFALALLAAVAATHFPHSRKRVLARIGHRYPVAAADYIRANHLPPPLFNQILWGGFLAWYLPGYPVAVDGRTTLYGDDYLVQYSKVMNFEQHFSTFAPLNQAGTLLLEKDSLMGKALPAVSGFKTAYTDDHAIVLVREQTAP